MTAQYFAIYNRKILSTGSLEHIITQVKHIDENIEPTVLNVESFKRIDFSWYGDIQTVLANTPCATAEIPHKRGRPKLGVKSREITLLPRHWDWLATQQGGASATLRRLVETAMSHISPEELLQMKQQQLDSFMMLILGDEAGFEQASRALYRNDRASFISAIEVWPTDIKTIIENKFDHICVLYDEAN